MKSKALQLLITALFILSFNCSLGQFYAVTPGENSQILGADSFGKNFEVKCDFNFVNIHDQLNPNLVEYNGKLYGVCAKLSSFGNYGGIYSYDVNTNRYQLEYELTANDGDGPENGLLLASNSLFYGTTKSGGNYGEGVLFSFNPLTKNYNVLHHFSSNEASGKKYQLAELSTGVIFGNAQYTSANSYGSIFSYTIATGNFSLKTSTTPIGSFICGLVKGNSTKSYTLTANGGNYGAGSVIEYDYIQDTIKRRYDFMSQPNGDFIKGNGSCLYGSQKFGLNSLEGTIFKYDYVSNTIQSVLKLDTVVGQEPNGKLFFLPNGKLYSGCLRTTNNNSDYLSFCFDTITKKYTTIDMKPYKAHINALLSHSNGKFYGINGTSMFGTYVAQIFELDINNNSIDYKMIYASAIRGFGGIHKLCNGHNNKLYGVFSEGGYNNEGTIFEYNNFTNETKTVFNFYDTLIPSSLGLALANDGKMYGGLLQHNSTLNIDKFYIYSIDPLSMQFQLEATDSTLYDCASEAFIKGKNGKLYFGGTRYVNGSFYPENLFAFDPNTKKIEYVSGFGGSHALMEVDSCDFLSEFQTTIYYNNIPANNFSSILTGTLFFLQGFSNMGNKNMLVSVGNNASLNPSQLYNYDLNNNAFTTIAHIDTICDFWHLFGNFCVSPNDSLLYCLAADKFVAPDDQIGIVKYDYKNNTFTTTDTLEKYKVTSGLPPLTQLIWGGAYQNTTNVLSAPNNKLELKIHPNPSRNEICIEYENNGTVEVISMSGKLMHKQEKSEKRIVLSMDNMNLQPGMYIIKVNSKYGCAYQKVVKLP